MVVKCARCERLVTKTEAIEFNHPRGFYYYCTESCRDFHVKYRQLNAEGVRCGNCGVLPKNGIMQQTGDGAHFCNRFCFMRQQKSDWLKWSKVATARLAKSFHQIYDIKSSTDVNYLIFCMVSHPSVYGPVFDGKTPPFIKHMKLSTLGGSVTIHVLTFGGTGNDAAYDLAKCTVLVNKFTGEWMQAKPDTAGMVAKLAKEHKEKMDLVEVGAREFRLAKCN